MTALGYVMHQLQNNGGRHQRFVNVGRVVNADDPEELGRVQCEFGWDYQGAHTAGWLMPIILGGDLGFDPPEVGDRLLCIFVEGTVMEGFYLGATFGRKKESKKALRELHGEDGMLLALAQPLEEILDRMLDWMQNHTHEVTVVAQGICAAPGAPLAGTPVTVKTMQATLKRPERGEVGSRRVRLRRRNDPRDRDTKKPEGL